MSLSTLSALVVALAGLAAGAPPTYAQETPRNPLIALWGEGKTAFGVYVPTAQQMAAAAAPAGGAGPDAAAGRGAAGGGGAGAGGRGGGGAGRAAAAGGGGAGGRGGGGQGAAAPAGPRYTREVGEALAANPLYDYVFLNLEGGGSYDPEAIRAIHEGLRGPDAVGYKALMVRIPSVATAGEEVTRARIREAFELGADAVTVPHVRNVEEARLVIGYFNEAASDIWSPENPRGERMGMIMLEDPQALLQAAEIAELPGYSILACGIGSMGQAFRAGGVMSALVDLGLLAQQDAAQIGEIASARVLAESTRTRRPNMITASAQNVRQRVADGYGILLFQGAAADDVIRTGREAAGR